MLYIAQIQDWFKSGCPFTQGLQIYSQTGGSYPLKHFHKYLEAPFVPASVESTLKTLLVSYLNDHIDEMDPAQEQIPEPVSEPVTPQPSVLSIFEPAAPPVEIQNLKASAKQLHKRQAFLHARLSTEMGEEQRLELATEIMEQLIPALDEKYKKIRAWENEGILPESSSDAIIQDTVAKMNKRASLRSRLTRISTALKGNLSDVERQQLKKEQAEKISLLQDIESHLKLN